MKAFESKPVRAYSEKTSATHLAEHFQVSSGRLGKKTIFSVVPANHLSYGKKYEHTGRLLAVQPLDQRGQVYEFEATASEDPRILAMLAHSAFIDLAIEADRTKKETNVFSLIPTKGVHQSRVNLARRQQEQVLEMAPYSNATYDEKGKLVGDRTPLLTRKGEIIMLGGTVLEMVGNSQIALEEHNLYQVHANLPKSA